jgi:hypothetical protein
VTGYYHQSTTACCPRETIPDSCSCPDLCLCLCLDCDCLDDDDQDDPCAVLTPEQFGDFTREHRIRWTPQ